MKKIDNFFTFVLESGNGSTTVMRQKMTHHDWNIELNNVIKTYYHKDPENNYIDNDTILYVKKKYRKEFIKFKADGTPFNEVLMFIKNKKYEYTIHKREEFHKIHPEIDEISIEVIAKAIAKNST